MKATFELIGTDKLEAELTLKMTLGQWKEFNEALPSKWPCGPVSSAILDMVRKATETFSGTYEKSGYDTAKKISPKKEIKS